MPKFEKGDRVFETEEKFIIEALLQSGYEEVKTVKEEKTEVEETVKPKSKKK